MPNCFRAVAWFSVVSTLGGGLLVILYLATFY